MINTDWLKQALPDNLKEKCFNNREYVDKGNVRSGVNRQWFSFVENLLSIIRLCGTSNNRLLKFDNYTDGSFEICNSYTHKLRILKAHNAQFNVHIKDIAKEDPFKAILLTFYRNNGDMFLQLESDPMFYKFDFEDVKALLENAFDSNINYGKYKLYHVYTNWQKGIYNPVEIVKVS